MKHNLLLITLTLTTLTACHTSAQSQLATADKANPLDAKIITYKDAKLEESRAEYKVQLVQTNLPELNLQLEEAYCTSWDFQHDETIAECKKQGVRQTIENRILQVKDEYKDAKIDSIRHFTQTYNYKNINNKPHFEVCTQDYNVGLAFGNQTLEKCVVYDISNPKKHALIQEDKAQ
ncbi:MAG: hypothetical protein IK065_04395 [Neisseriaceae bacterium]|nr:hypothetical protein [Neisseriaceae bacterium]